MCLRGWAVWDLPAWLSAYVIAVVAVYGAAIGTAASVTSFHRHDLQVFLILMACNAASVEMTRRTGEPSGLVKDVYMVWEFPVAILLPPLYGLLVPIPRLLLTQWRIRRALAYRRVFSAAAVGLGYAGASVIFHAIGPVVGGASPGPGLSAFLWVLVLAVSGIGRWVVNMGILVVALKGAEPATPMLELLWGRELLYNDVAELCIAVLVTFAVASSALLAAFALPFVTLLQRSQRHAQLLDASRIDAKTGLLNAAAWQREAAVQLARAIRTHTPLAVAIADLDHFKAINDTYGHPEGDRVLQAVAATLEGSLRDSDVVARTGGEEFSLLLPDTDLERARRTAERVRREVADLSGTTDASGDAPHPRVSASLGVASLDFAEPSTPTTASAVERLLQRSDDALYRAKRAGRDRVVADASQSHPDPAAAERRRLA